jgi:hypothetical protein
MKSSHSRPLYLDENLVLPGLWNGYILELEYFWTADMVDLECHQCVQYWSKFWPHANGFHPARNLSRHLGGEASFRKDLCSPWCSNTQPCALLSERERASSERHEDARSMYNHNRKLTKLPWSCR